MLKIWTDLEDTKRKHVHYCKQFVAFRYQQYKDGKILTELSQSKRKSLDALITLAIANIDMILGRRIQWLKEFDEDIKAVNKDYRNLKDNILEIFDYHFFSYTGLPYNKKKLWGSYQLVDGIGLKTCPYCNENCTYSIYDKGSGKMRAELDHFLPKSIYPFFALSFYNLIPVCHSCNHVKQEQQIVINPHDDHFDDNDRFVFIPGRSFIPLLSNDTSDSKVIFESDDLRKKKQVNKLRITERYNHHKDIVVDIYRNKEIYNKIYNKSLNHLVPELGHLSDKDIFRMLFNVSPQLEEYHEKPYSKLTNDLLRQLNS
ncbi:MAG: HNH endonuclease domain-containing protein [Candidatus Cloacimonetes bacterium]|jgi:hypothetical protein|nr:HNH endonuclease domain-containing protein [Candidatus Cloacimonadota bacterium]MDY0326196.1 HNH endonuclease domain-containing protein [Candidatus Cloacimonadaceae bacterium]